MNILVLVSSFLLILSFVSATAVKKVIAFESEKKSFVGFMQGTRTTRNMWENKKFIDATKGIVSPLSFSPEKPAPIQQILPEDSHRTKKILPHLAKLNLKPLFKKETSTPLLYETAARLLRHLYSHGSFLGTMKEEKWEYEILDEMIKKAMASNPISSLCQLYPSSKELQGIFYKMLKGTGDYNLSTAEGYPPLGDFFMIDDMEKKPIYFCYASLPLLSALFGENTAREIMTNEAEKSKKDQKFHTTTKAELEALLLKKGSHGKNLTDFEELLNFSKKRTKLECLTHKDKNSGVSISMPLPSAAFKNL